MLQVLRALWLVKNPCFIRVYIITQVILAFLLGLAYDLLEDRHTIDVIITEFFASAVLKWQKVLRIRIIFSVTGQKIRYKKVLPRHWTGSRSQKAKDKALSFRKGCRNNFLAASVGSRARLNHAQNLVLVSREPLLHLNLTNPINKMFLRLIYLKKLTFPSVKTTVDTLIDVRNETSKHHFLKSVK